MFPILDTHRSYYKERNFPNFGRPKVIGFLSINGQREFHPDASQLKFVRNFSEGPVSYDLNHEIDKVNGRIAVDEKIDFLLRFLLYEKARKNICLSSKTIERAKLICYRGLLTCIALTPFEHNEPWRIIVTLFDGAIYMCSRDTDAKLIKKENMSLREKTCSTWGYKFEQYIVSDTPFSNPNLERPSNENEEFNVVLQNKLNDHELFYCAEMDGIRTDNLSANLEPPDIVKDYDGVLSYLKDKQFVELKTNRKVEFPNQEKNLRRFKMKRWWCQSFLAGVEDILCGFRNDDGLVECLKSFKVASLPKMCKQHWDPNVCFKFLDTFLTYVKRCLSHYIVKKHGEQYLNNLDQLEPVTLHFEWSPGSPVRVTDNFDRVADQLIPDWFVTGYRSSQQN